MVFTNTGTVSVQSGTLQLDDGGTSAASALSVGSAATLAFGGGTFTVTGSAYDVAGGTEVDGATADFTAATITSLGNLLTISSGELLLGSNTTSISAYDGTGGTLDGSGTVTITGAATLDGDTETGTGTTILDGATTLSGSLTLGGRTMENKGTITWTGTGNIVLGTSGESGGTLVNEAGAIFNLQSDASSIAESGTDTLINAGLLEKTTLAGTSTIQAALTSSGTVSVTDGNLDLAGSAGLSGTIDIAVGARLLLTGTASFSGATVTGGGRVYAEGPTSITGLTVGATTIFEVTGTTTESDGTITLGDTTGDVAQLFVNAGGTYDITDNSGIAIGAGTNSQVTADHLFEKTGGSGTSTIAASITDSGTITATIGTLAFTGAKDYFAGAITGAGTVALDGAHTALDAGTSISVANLAIGGLVQLNVGLSDADALHETGTIWLGQNTLTLSGADTISGSITGGSGTVSGSLVFAGGSDLLSAGASIAVSQWTISGGTTTLAESLHYLTTFSGGAASIALDSGASLYLNGTSTLDGTTINGAGDLYVGGAASVSDIGVGGTAELSIAGTVTESGGSTTLGSSGGGAAEIYVLASGTFDLADNSGVTSGGTGGSLIVNKGVLEKTAGTGTSTIATVVANYGTIEVTSGVLAIGSTLYGTGTDDIGTNGTLKLSGSVSSAQTVEFSASSGKLTLADPSGNHLSFAGTIDGFDGADRIDLAGFGYVAGNPVWNQAAGTLTITVGTKQAVLDLGGTYTSANFVQSSDDNGGTVITFTGTTTAAPRYASDTMNNAAKTVFSAGNAPSITSKPSLDTGRAFATAETVPGPWSLIDHQAARFDQPAGVSPYLEPGAGYGPALSASLRSDALANFQIAFHQHL